MASLVPCTVCRRHVRRHETQCRFCGAERTPELAAGEVALPRDVKRATLFALGLTLAGQACAESNDVPIYGAPSVMGGGSGGGGGSNAAGNGGSGGSSTMSDGGSGQVQPVYGAPVSPAGGTGGALPMSAVDAGSDAGNADSGSDAGN